jgi:hypothetical protein
VEAVPTRMSSVRVGKKRSRRPDPLLDAVDSVRDYVLHAVQVANWGLTLACACAFVSRLVWPMLPDDMAARSLLEPSALGLGACTGKAIDRRLARRANATSR